MYAFRRSIPGKKEVDTTSFAPHFFPIAPAAMGSSLGTKSAASTPLSLGIHLLNAYKKKVIHDCEM